MRDSNSPLKLGRLRHNPYTNPACEAPRHVSASRRLQPADRQGNHFRHLYWQVGPVSRTIDSDMLSVVYYAQEELPDAFVGVPRAELFDRENGVNNTRGQRVPRPVSVTPETRSDVTTVPLKHSLVDPGRIELPT